jgi:hypothetical protein
MISPVRNPVKLPRRAEDTPLYFVRESAAYRADGTQVIANIPRLETGKFGKAIMVEGTTNAVADPSFENADITANWNAAGSANWAYTGMARVRDTTRKKYGSASVKCGDGAVHGKGIAEKNQGTAAHAVSAGQIWTLSFDVYATNADTQYIALIRCYDSSGNNISDSVTPPSGWQYTSYYQALYFYQKVPGANAWYRITKQFTVPSGVAYVAISLQYYDGGNYYVWFDGVQFENKPYATSFIDGTRAAETLTIPTAGVLNPQEGTVKGFVNLWRAPGTTAQYIFDGAGAVNQNLVVYVGTDGKLRLEYGDGASMITLVGSTVLQKDTWYSVAWRWSSSGVELLLNGNLEASNINLPSLSFGANACLGSKADGTAQLDGLLDNFSVSGRVVPNVEVLEEYRSSMPKYSDEWTTALVM